MKNEKRGTVDYSVVNRLRIETVEDFENSLFARQYEEASALISEIIVNNELVEKDFKDMQWLKFEFFNIVPFLGGRGTGKTSAMFSYSTLLRNYKSYLEREETDVKITDNNPTGIKKFLLGNIPISYTVPSFLVLDSVDASMLGNDKGVLEVILAKMWTYYNQELKSGQWDIEVEKQTEIAKLFSDLRQDYQRYLKNSDDKEISNIKQLSNLAGTLNFRATFQKLLRVFLKLFSNGSKKYLVLMLDDIDMAGKNTFKALEQLRLFLCIPNIIILLTADLKRLKQIVGNYYCDVYITDKRNLDIEFATQNINRLRDEFVDDYLGKIMPSNMRIFMPDIYILNPKIVENEKMQTVSEKILKLFFQCGIYFDGIAGRHHFLEEKTLRRNANMLHTLNENGKAGSETFENLLHWLQINIRGRILDRVESEAHKLKLEKVFHIDIEELNEYIVRIIGSELDGSKVIEELMDITYERDQYLSASNLAHYNLGEVLYGCSLLRKQDNEYEAFIDFILAYYTEIYIKYEDKRKYLIGHSIWGDWTDFMVQNLKNSINQYALYRWDVGLNMSLQELEFIIPVEKLMDEGCFSNEITPDNVKYSEKAILRFICRLLEDNISDIVAFQAIFAFFYNPSYVTEIVRKEPLFEFSRTIHKGIPGRVVLSRNTNETKAVKPEQNAGGENGLREEDLAVESYKIVIKPKSSMYARFNIDYPIVDTAFIKNVSLVFKRQLLKGLRREILDIIEEIQSADNWKDEILSLSVDNKKDISRIRLSGNVFLLNRIKRWEKKYPGRKYVFPVENIQMVYNIGRKLEANAVLFAKERFYTIVHDIYVLINGELEKRDCFYEVDTNSDASYAKVYREYPVIALFLEKEYMESFQKMFQNILRDEDTTKRVDRGLNL